MRGKGGVYSKDTILEQLQQFRDLSALIFSRINGFAVFMLTLNFGLYRDQACTTVSMSLSSLFQISGHVYQIKAHVYRMSGHVYCINGHVYRALVVMSTTSVVMSP